MLLIIVIVSLILKAVTVMTVYKAPTSVIYKDCLSSLFKIHAHLSGGGTAVAALSLTLE